MERIEAMLPELAGLPAAAPRPPLPPFSVTTAIEKVRMAEDAWNTRDPHRVALAYTEDSQWRNRAEFIAGRDAIRQFLVRKWSKEAERKFRWPLGRRPDDHPGLSELGL